MNKPTYPKPDTQRRIILDALIASKGNPVGLNYLMRLANCGSVHSAISTLRSVHGWNITNKQASIRKHGKIVRTSSYTLPVGQIEPRPGEQVKP